MKIKYSKFEINRWDIFFLILFLGHLLGGIDILFNKKEEWLLNLPLYMTEEIGNMIEKGKNDKE